MSTGTYQGHLADGSSIQKHSAGGLFPYILFGKQAGEKLLWGVMAPNGAEHMFVGYDNAHDFALGCKHYDQATSKGQKAYALDEILMAKNRDTLARLAVR